MKRLKIMTTILMAAMLLSGCSQNDSMQGEKENVQPEAVKLTVWGGPNEQDLLAQMIENFKQEYAKEAIFDVTVAAELESECRKEILAAVSEAPDVFTFIDDQVMELAAAGVLEKVDGAEQIRTENTEGAVEAAAINEAVYAYPMTADNGYFMFYNKKYLSEKDVTSLNQMLAVAGSLNKKVTMDWTSGWYLYSFFGNTGLKMGLNPDGITNYCDWNSSSGGIKGTDVGNAMVAIAKNPGFMSAADEELVAGAKNGSVIAGVSGVWLADKLQKIWGNDFAAVKLPTYTCSGKEVQMASYAGYKLIGVNAYSEEKEWAAKLAQWLTNEENQKLRFEQRGLVPSNKMLAEAEEVKASPTIKALIEQAEYASVQRVGPKYWEASSNFGKSVLDGSTTADNMQQRMNVMVKEITMKITD